MIGQHVNPRAAHQQRTRPCGANARAGDLMTAPPTSNTVPDKSSAQPSRTPVFKIDHEQRIAFKPSPITPSIPHILGTARRA